MAAGYSGPLPSFPWPPRYVCLIRASCKETSLPSGSVSKPKSADSLIPALLASGFWASGLLPGLLGMCQC